MITQDPFWLQLVDMVPVVGTWCYRGAPVRRRQRIVLALHGDVLRWCLTLAFVLLLLEQCGSTAVSRRRRGRGNVGVF